MRNNHALRGSQNHRVCPVIIIFAVVRKSRLRLFWRTFMSSGCWTEIPLASPSVTAVVPPHEPVSPKISFVQRMTAILLQVLGNENPRACSLIARFKEVLDTPDVQVQEPLVVVKKRGRPAGSKNKTSITKDKSHFEYVEGRMCGVCGQSKHNSRTCPQS